LRITGLRIAWLCVAGLCVSGLRIRFRGVGRRRSVLLCPGLLGTRNVRIPIIRVWLPRCRSALLLVLLRRYLTSVSLFRPGLRGILLRGGIALRVLPLSVVLRGAKVIGHSAKCSRFRNGVDWENSVTRTACAKTAKTATVVRTGSARIGVWGPKGSVGLLPVLDVDMMFGVCLPCVPGRADDVLDSVPGVPFHGFVDALR
jgi:hypothetical protein